MRKIKKQPIEVTGKEETFKPTRLDQIIGEFNEFAIYGTKNEFEYATQIGNMSRQELETHANRVGIVPVEGEEQLRNILLKEFRIYNQSIYRSASRDNNPDVIPENIKKILAEQKNTV